MKFRIISSVLLLAVISVVSMVSDTIREVLVAEAATIQASNDTASYIWARILIEYQWGMWLSLITIGVLVWIWYTPAMKAIENLKPTQEEKHHEEE